MHALRPYTLIIERETYLQRMRTIEHNIEVVDEQLRDAAASYRNPEAGAWADSMVEILMQMKGAWQKKYRDLAQLCADLEG